MNAEPLTFEQLALEVGALVDRKNAAYGNAFDKAGDFLRLLYPNGITPDQMADALCLVRIFDKMMRIATHKDALGESPYQDIVGYGLLGLRRGTQPTKPTAPTVVTEDDERLRAEDEAEAWRRGFLDAVAGSQTGAAFEMKGDEAKAYADGHAAGSAVD